MLPLEKSQSRPQIDKMISTESQFNVLSLSGGGFRGLFTAQVLHELEKHARKPIGQCFDLICGTSIGGLLALSIGLEKPMESVIALMRENGEKIFPKRREWKLPTPCGTLSLSGGMCRAKYGNDALKSAVEMFFDGARVGDSQHPLVIPTVNYSGGNPQMFKTSHAEKLTYDLRIKMSDVAMATSAAPIYFPLYEFGGECYVDGGIAGNNPALIGVHEATHFMNRQIESICMLSIGTMSGQFRRDESQPRNLGVLGWGERLFQLSISAQEQVADHIVEHLLDGRYYKIDDTPAEDQIGNIGLDLADKSAIATLQNMGKKAGKKFVGLRDAKRFIEHSAQKFEPCHKLEGENNHAESQ